MAVRYSRVKGKPSCTTVLGPNSTVKLSIANGKPLSAHKKTGHVPGFFLAMAMYAQRITCPFELMIVISTNFEPTWLDGEKLTLKPPKS